MLLTKYHISTDLVRGRVTCAVCADLHDKEKSGLKCLKLLDKVHPDLILLPGDIVENHAFPLGYGISFLKDISQIAPSFMSLGNHETGGRHHFVHGKDILMNSSEAYGAFLQAIRSTGVRLLDNESVICGTLHIGGIPSPMYRGEDNRLAFKDVDRTFLDSFEQEEGFKILLFHHPELYAREVEGRNIQLTLSGHAHGGQIRLLGQGLYAPGQGLFPKLTSGIHAQINDPSRIHIISKGLSNNTPFPRLFNPCELVQIQIEGI